jgi:predicted ATPase/DNA-binding SARP family transcriptional activator
MLKFYAFGVPRLEQDGNKLPLGRRKALAMLAYLAISGQPQARDSLLALLWPEHEPDSARANLRRDLSYLRRNLGREHLSADRVVVGLDLDTEWWVDVHQFRGLVRTAKIHDHSEQGLCHSCIKALTEAVELYGDDLLAGFSLPDAPGFDGRLFFEREGLRQELAAAVQALMHHHSQAGDYGIAINYGRRWLALDTFNEPAHRELMRLYAWSGQQAAALRQFREGARLLNEELGVAPEAETTALFEMIKAKRLQKPGRKLVPEMVEADSAPHPISPTLLPDSVAHNLPRLATPFVGREGELAALDELIANPDVRLVTIVALGGMGKTRLALVAAERQLESNLFPDGVYFVPLAAVGEPDQIAAAIAEALWLRFYGRASPEEQLQRQLQQKKVLLVLDNFEQLTSGAGRLTALLEAAPGAKLLLTSRERLNLALEWNFELFGLPYPSEEELVDSPEQLMARNEGLQLFAHRARQADGSFEPTIENLPHIIRISQLVGGMPLGLELAAAWKALISCREIAEEIERNLDILDSTMRDVEERHRSLRAVFRHSWALLTPNERTIFRKLSVFRGGFTREAARQVARASLADLAGLIRKSLVRREPEGRYQVHELLRQYASEQLAEDPVDEEATRKAHAAFFAKFLEERREDVYGGRQIQALDEIAAEIDNVRYGWRWAVSRCDNVTLGQMTESLYHFCEIRGQFPAGIDAFRGAVEMLRRSTVGETPTEQRQTLGMLLIRQGALLARVGHADRATVFIQEGVDLLRTVGPTAHLALAKGLSELAIRKYMLGQGSVARQLLEECLELAKTAGESRLAGYALCGLGDVAEFEGRYREADGYYSHSLKPLVQAGEKHKQTYALNNRGRALYAMGDYGQAQQLIQRALASRQQVSHQITVAFSLLDLGNLARMRGHYEEAERHLRECRQIAEYLGLQITMARVHNARGMLERARGRLAMAEEDHLRSLTMYRETGVRSASPLTLNGLAAVALAQGEAHKANAYLRESLDIASELDNVGDQAVARHLLGNLAATESRWQEADDHYRQALLISHHTGALPLTLEIFVGVATLDLIRPAPKPERATGLLALVQAHPAATQETREKAAALASKSEGVWGKELELDLVLAELLAGENDGDAASDEDV